MKTALVIGATGLVGKRLVKQLLDDERFEQVVVFTRRRAGFSAVRYKEHIIDFNKPEDWQHLVKGDVLFSTLGTTLRKAGSKKAQFQVDYAYQYQFAVAAARNNVSDYVLVSSVGADLKSRFFYNQMKGQLERDVSELDFSRIIILRPGPLDGERDENRPAERKGLAVIRALNKLGLFCRYRPIMDHQVAQAMINAVFIEKTGTMVFENQELFGLSEAGQPV